MSDTEMQRFCQSYMTELFHHIGPETDVPAGDIGVGSREIGYLFGQYKRLTHTFDGTWTGKGIDWGGSMLRPEATGYGIVYFLEEMLKVNKEAVAGKTLCVSGFGNVAWGVVKKATELGGRVVTLSGPDGFIHDPDGIRGDKIDYLLTMRNGSRDEVKQYAEKFGVEFHPGKRPWGVPCDVAIPCAIQNELDGDDAATLVKNGCKHVVEGANMPATHEAREAFTAAGIPFAPGKASNAGGVACSGLEMAQNHSNMSWGQEKVDVALHDIMVRIHGICRDAAERYGRAGDYVVGANVAGFARIADAMIDQGPV